MPPLSKIRPSRLKYIPPASEIEAGFQPKITVAPPQPALFAKPARNFVISGPNSCVYALRYFGGILAISRLHTFSLHTAAREYISPHQMGLFDAHEGFRNKIPPTLIRVRVAHHSFDTARFSPSYPQMISTMKAESQRLEDRASAISALKAASEAVDLAEKTSSIAPAKTAFNSVSTLLTTIRVCFLFLCNDLPRVHIQPGLDGLRTGSRRARVTLRRYLQTSLPGDEWKESGRAQSTRV